ncbi:MAG: hypothetical protein POELPBGB_02565 [Bacteroidia bacterium]|nr:hypothetical protein [Bacteroidia bacterium]
MKIYRSRIMLIVLAAVLTQTGCKTIERALYNVLRATVNNKLFSTQVVSGTVVAGRLTLAATTTTGSQAMTIVVPSTIKPGNYKLTSTGSYLIEYKAGNHDVYAASSGELTITSHDTNLKKIKGTFHFKGLNLRSASVDVTNGSFTVSYY